MNPKSIEMNQAKLSPLLMVMAVLLLASIPIAVGGARYSAAKRSNTAAQARLQSVVNDANELLRLQASTQQAVYGEPPENDLLARIAATLTESGLPSRSLKSAATESDRAADGDRSSTLRLRTARVTLEPLRPAELGRFLERWHASGNVWTPTQIELSAMTDRGATQGTYSVRLQLTARYVAAAPVSENTR